LTEAVISELQKSFEVEINIKSETYVSLKLDKILKIDLVNDIPFRYGELQKTDIKINELKEQLKDLNDGYKGVINEKLKRLNYLLLLLESRGKL
jgi:arsenate reductase-like glutaredoxin family protein